MPKPQTVEPSYISPTHASMMVQEFDRSPSWLAKGSVKGNASIRVRVVRRDDQGTPDNFVEVNVREGYMSEFSSKKRYVEKDTFFTMSHEAAMELHRMLNHVLGEVEKQALTDWVAQQWHEQVANRPMINVHRRSLDDTWRQVLRHLGVDDRARLGPTHDELRAEIGSKEWAAMNGTDLNGEPLDRGTK